MALADVKSAPRSVKHEDDWDEMLQALSLQPERTALPALEEPLPAANLWKIIKDAVGSESLVAIPLPLVFHEPITELMKRAEDLKHAYLLNEVTPNYQLIACTVLQQQEKSVHLLSQARMYVTICSPALASLLKPLQLADEKELKRQPLSSVQCSATGSRINAPVFLSCFAHVRSLPCML